MEKTLDRLQQAKDALLYALHAAEREAPAGIVKKLEKLTGDCEALQARVSADIYRTKGARLR